MIKHNAIIITDKNGRFNIDTEENKNALNEFLNFDLIIGSSDIIKIKDLQLANTKIKQNEILFEYYIERYELRLKTNLYLIPNCNVIKQKNTLINIGSKSIHLSKFSSAVINNIAADGDLNLFDENKIKIHYCNSGWQAEGQWQESTLDKLGIIPSTNHLWGKSKYRFQSLGSWCTATYYPLVIAESTDTNKCFYMEIENSQNWFIEVGCNYGYKANGLYLEATACDETCGNWNYTLKPGESYSAPSAAFGCVNGGFEEVVKEMTIYKRFDTKVSYPKKQIPVVFNDYMNCLWANPSDSKLLPLIDKAAEIGAEIFCIDAGWQKNENSEQKGLGDWIVNDALFGKIKFQGILNYIKSKGLIPGIWFELDACENTARAYNLSEDCLLKRYDSIIGNERAFFNFKNEAVRRHLNDRIDELYSMGIRYIKNDYNQTTGIGPTNFANSAAQGLIDNSEAFYDFINEVINKHGDLIIENCGSGGLREDNGTLRHFHMQSTSDQEIYYNYPSIILGSLACMPPEKAGIWSYPYPVSYSEKLNFELTNDYIKTMEDGEQTIFNMVNSMCGSMYLSGRIDNCDELNLSLIKRGVEIFKKYRNHIINSYPVYPLGTMRMNKKGFCCLGLVSSDNKLLTLSVWRIDSDEEIITIDLSKNISSSVKVSMIYPDSSDTWFEYSNSKLSIKLSKKYSARMFQLKESPTRKI